MKSFNTISAQRSTNVSGIPEKDFNKESLRKRCFLYISMWNESSPSEGHDTLQLVVFIFSLFVESFISILASLKVRVHFKLVYGMPYKDFGIP